MPFAVLFREGWWSAALSCGALGSASLLGGCGDRESPGRSSTTAASASIAPGAPGAPGAAASGASSGGAAKTGPAPAAARHALEGTWEGTYRAEQAKPTLSPTVKDRAWARDDGKRAVGEGAIRIVVGPMGEVGGSLEGPLGPADLVGAAEEKRLFASVVPRGEDGATFAGVIEATLEGGNLEVVLRASDGPAETVRAGKATLKLGSKP